MAGLTICTLTSAGYEPYTRVLAASLARHQPESSLVVCALDGPDSELDRDGIEQLSPVQLGVAEDDLHRVAAGSAIALLADRLKPAILSSLLERTGGPVLLIDSDSAVYDRLDPLLDELAHNPILLTPHSREISPGTSLNQCEIAQLRCGVINGGFIAVAPGAEPFLDWLWNRARAATVPDDSERLLHAQRWLDLSIGYFGPRVWRDPAYNLTMFDLLDRDIDWDHDRPTVGGRPVRHFHFLTGIDPFDPSSFTTNPIIAEAWPQPSERPGASRLFDDYRERLIAAGYGEQPSRISRFAAFADGEPIPALEKSLYSRAIYSHEHAGTSEPPNPFRDGRLIFQTWAASMRPEP